MNNFWLKLLVSLLICTLLTAVLLVSMGYFSDVLANNSNSFLSQLQSQNTGKGLVYWLQEGLLGLFYLMIFCYWLLFIPGLLLFWFVVNRQPRRDYSYYLFLGLGIGSVTATILYGLSCVLPPWSMSPVKSSIWPVIVMNGAVGALYGLAYRKWFMTTRSA